MASQWPPKKNTAFTLYFSLYKSDGKIIANPGTYTKKVSIDGAAVADIAAAVTEEDTTYGQLSVVLASGEMNGDAIWVYIVDDTDGCVPFTCTLYTAGSLHDEVKADTAAILADTGTDGVVLAADAITAAKIADDAFSSEHFATGCISADAVADGTIDAGALAADCITSAKIADDALGPEHFADSFYAQLGIVASGTAQSATATTLVLAAASAFADDELNGAVVVITGGTGIGQSRVITHYTGSTDTAEVDAWTTTPSGTITYAIFAAAPASATSLPAVNVTQIAGSAVATGTAQLGVNVVSVTNDAITAAALAADVTTELQSGLATAATVNSLTAYVSPGISSIYGGMATAAALTVVDDFLDTEVSSILGNAVAIQAAVSSVTAYVNPGVSSIYSGLPSAVAVASLVWQEAIASHGGVGTTGAALTAAGSAGDPWSTALPGSYGAGTAGLLVGTNLTTPLSSVSADVPAVLARTNTLVAYVNPGISSIKGDTAAALARTNSIVAYVSPGISSIYNALDVEIASIKGDTAAVLLRANSLIAHVSPAISSIYGGMATAAALATVDDFLDTEVSSLLGYASAITAQTALLPSSPAAAGDAMTLTDAAVDAVLDEPVEGAYTLRQALRLVLAVNAGKVSGAGTSSITIRDINDTADRITAEVDASGNRATVTKNVS